MDLHYPDEREADRQFGFLFSKAEWTLSQAVFLIFDQLYIFQDVFKNEYLPDASFFFYAVETMGSSPEAKLYLKAARCIRAKVLKGRWVEKECDYRIKPSDFVQWAAPDIQYGSRVDRELEMLTGSKSFPYERKIQENAKHFLHACSLISDDPVPREEIIAFVRGRLSLHQSDKTLGNYIGKIPDPTKRKKGCPQKCPSQKKQKKISM